MLFENSKRGWLSTPSFAVGGGDEEGEVLRKGYAVEQSEPPSTQTATRECLSIERQRKGERGR